LEEAGGEGEANQSLPCTVLWIMHGTFCFMGPVGILANRSLPCLCWNISGDSASGIASHKRLIYAQSFQWPIACSQVQRELSSKAGQQHGTLVGWRRLATPECLSFRFSRVKNRGKTKTTPPGCRLGCRLGARLATDPK
jgi:hypothetical protein